MLNPKVRCLCDVQIAGRACHSVSFQVRPHAFQRARANSTVIPLDTNSTRLVYSRDQLLSLASSPLSQTPPKGLSSFPPEISRSPDKHDKGLRQLASNRAAGLRGSGPGASGVDAFAGQGSASTNGTLPTAVARGPTTSAGQDATGIATGVDGPHLRQQNGTSDKGQEEQFEMDL